jgi:signal transduction histidine kinase
MEELTGAVMVVQNARGQTLAATRDEFRGVSLPTTSQTEGQPSADDHVHLQTLTSVAGIPYFHACMPLHSRSTGTDLRLHVLYSKEDYDLQVRRAVWPAAWTGILAAGVVVGLAVWFAARISRPMRTLNQQVDRIASGHFEEMPLPRANREVEDLASAVNKMAVRLSDYESHIRQTEQLHLLGLLGGGLAHQLRNTVTGARMAMDFHRETCEQRDDENLTVVARQLELMEQYLKKFLAIANPDQPCRESVDLVGIVEGLLPLVAPAARHAQSSLVFDGSRSAIHVDADADALSQAILNLILNAIDAVQTNAGDQARTVNVVLKPSEEDGQAHLSVIDNGPGPPEAIAMKLFDPLVSGKQGGVGLGLFIVEKIVHDHGGEVFWQREGEKTVFEIRLPLAK